LYSAAEITGPRIMAMNPKKANTSIMQPLPAPKFSADEQLFGALQTKPSRFGRKPSR
jgi:hypothetical protein